jgi:drug/metabolite transporter (DMT)-like permease
MGWAALLATVALWASAFPAIRIALRGFEPVPLASLRFAIAAIAMLAWLVVARHGRSRVPPLPDAWRFLACAALGVAAYNILLNMGQRTVTPGAASFIVNTGPVITALIAIVFLRERFGPWAWIGSAISFGGVALIASGQPQGLRLGAGASLIMLAAVAQAVFFAIQRPLVARHGAGLCAPWVVIFGAVLLLPRLPEALSQAAVAPAAALAAVVYLGFFPAAAGYATWAVAQACFGASRAANGLYLVPPAATALAWCMTGDVPQPISLLGGALGILGVVIVNTRGRPG